MVKGTFLLSNPELLSACRLCYLMGPGCKAQVTSRTQTSLAMIYCCTRQLVSFRRDLQYLECFLFLSISLVCKAAEVIPCRRAGGKC